MAINRVEIKDFLVFHGEFAVDFCQGINVIIGSNATGKTTLLKVMYAVSEHSTPIYNTKSDLRIGDYFLASYDNTKAEFFYDVHNKLGKCQIVGNGYRFGWIDGLVWMKSQGHPTEGIQTLPMFICESPVKSEEWTDKPYINATFIPITEMLSHSKSFLALCHERKMPFDVTQIDILAKAELPETHGVTSNTTEVIDKISKVISGEVLYEGDVFYIKKHDGMIIPFSLEASGFQKFGLLWKLLRNGLLESGSVLFWDEPEASINPELMSVLVDILLDLQRGGVQVFIATHSEILASYFAVNRKTDNEVMFYSLFKDGEQIRYDKSDRFDLLTPNTLTAEQVNLYEREIEKGLGNGT